MKVKRLCSHYKNLLFLGAAAFFIGIVVGAVDALFGRMLLLITSVREANAFWLIPFLPAAGACILYCYRKFGKGSGKGMNFIFEAGHGASDEIPLRMIPFAMISTWLTHLFGGSAGREGVAIQIGGTIAHGIGRRIPIENGSKILLITGMAAGFAGLFQTPIAAVFFAMEVFTVGVLECGAVFPALIASFTASYTSHLLDLEKFSIALADAMRFDLANIIKIAALGVIFGVAGGLFAHLLHFTKGLFSKWFKDPVRKAFVIGAFISAGSLLCGAGRYSGLGTNLIAVSFGKGVLTCDFALKFLFTVVTLAAGFQGGEVTPLFAIGASLGAVIAPLLHMPVMLAAALGYVCVFGSATNTLIAPMIIGCEVFGYGYLPFFFPAGVLAYIFNGNNSIYALQKGGSSWYASALDTQKTD